MLRNRPRPSPHHASARLIIALGLLVRTTAIIAIEMMVVKMEQGWDRRARPRGDLCLDLDGVPHADRHAWLTAAGFLPVGFAKSSAGEYAGGNFSGSSAWR